MLSLTLTFGFSAVSERERVLIWFVVRVDVQLIEPCRPYPFCGARWWTWRQRLWCGWFSLSEGFCVYPVHEELVEVAYECCQQQEHSVLCHEGLWQLCPSEAIVPLHSRRHRSRHLTKNPQSRALITERCAPKSQDFVDYRTHKTGKCSLTWNIPPKGVIFSDFMLTFAMSLMIFACLDLQH